jgi:hypothetical protein
VAGDREIWERFGEVERKLNLLYEHLGLDMPEEPAADEVSPEVLELIREDKLAEATKLHREQSDVSLPEANALVQRLSGTV